MFSLCKKNNKKKQKKQKRSLWDYGGLYLGNKKLGIKLADVIRINDK